jgi:catechol 2,3-dioxygenase-like lactoylglutathione lyase family enzyme
MSDKPMDASQREVSEMSAQSTQGSAAGGLTSLTLHNLATVVSDLDAAVDWYQRVLGFSCQARIDLAEGEVAVLSGAGVQLELLTPSRMDEAPVRLDALFAPPPRHLLAIGNKFLVFEVDDLARASAELAELSVEILWREKELAPGWVATAIRDCDGNLINIFQRH